MSLRASVAPLHTSTGLQHERRAGFAVVSGQWSVVSGQWSVVSSEFPALSSFHSSHLTLHSSLLLPLPPDQAEGWVRGGQWSVVSFRLCLHFTLPISLFTLRFCSLCQPTNARQPASSPAWERAGGEGRQRRRLGSVAPLHTSTGLQHERRVASSGNSTTLFNSTFDI